MEGVAVCNLPCFHSDVYDARGAWKRGEELETYVTRQALRRC